MIIGGGVIGLCLAYEISRNSKFQVFLIEKNKTFGLEASTKNSEVIHSGVYYKNNSLKAKLCVQGKRLIYKFCKKYKIPNKKIQKLFIGNSKSDLKLIQQMYKNAKINKVKDIKIIGKDLIKKIEPNIIANYALLSKSSGIFDVNGFMKKVFYLCKKNKVKFLFKRKISHGICNKNKFIFNNIKLNRFDYVINAAGLGAIKIANRTFKNKLFPSDRPLVGLYFQTKQNLGIKRIIYPAMKPKKNLERVDITPSISGRYIFGPSVEKKGKINTKKTKLKFDKFLNKVHLYLDKSKIKFFKKGVRPKIMNKTNNYQDFYIKKVDRYNWINLFGIESPGLTSALSIAKYVKRIL